MTRRVVVTGVGVTSPIGNSLDEISDALREQKSGVRVQQAWKEISGLNTFLAAPTIADLDFSKKKTRTMGRVSLLALRATLDAVEDSQLSEEDRCGGRCGVSFGSTQGSSEALSEFSAKIMKSNGGLIGVRPTNYIKFMSHTCSVNLAIYFEITGRIITTCSACTSGSQGVGYGYEAIKYGLQDIMITGGSEELHYTHAGVFDLLRSTSTKYNNHPADSPRPFDADRDGLVVGEGATTLVLEELEHAKARGAKIYCEVAGYGTTCDGVHITSPSEKGMSAAIANALSDANIGNDQIEYVNAHATATQIGDICESRATLASLGGDVPVSSTKGLTGHTLGAAGALESLVSIAALTGGFLPPNYNLKKVGPDCAPLNYVLEPEDRKLEIVMNNNFAFGGINTSLVFRKI